jgi:pimeloyl-ACP methyl ester carboxylesterase
MVAQAFVRRCPQRVANLVLSHTGGPEAERAVKNRKFIGILRWMPMPMLRSLLRLSTRKALQAAPERIPFWEAYSDELIDRLSRDHLLGRYLVAIDFDATSSFTPGDLEGWPGRILILEGDDDPVADASARQLLKTLHPQAQVHTFHGSGHVASIARVDEYSAVIRKFLSEEI